MPSSQTTYDNEGRTGFQRVTDIARYPWTSVRSNLLLRSLAMSEYTAIVKETLRITLHEALEANRAEARSAATEDFEEIRIAV